MIEGQTTIFDMMYQKFKIDKPIRTIELFGGYGSQLLSLKYIGANVEQWKLCEWAVKSIQAYKDIHFPDDDTDYSKDISLEDLIEKLHLLGISSNYNEPMTKEQIKRLNEKQVRTIYNNIKATHNLVNIQSIHADDLEIKDKDKYCYIMTYSFPCQDLSLAGKCKGMSDTSTRSGLLWEVERLLSECQELPQVLLMENVPMVHSVDNLDDFNKWKLRLEELGYKNYFQDLIATDYGIPQTRNRCFMVSILGNYCYTFPKPIPLKLKLKDMLEDNVDEKYYIKNGTLKCFLTQKENGFPRKERFLQALELTNKKQLAGTLTALQDEKATDNHILVKNTENYIEWYEKGKLDMDCRAWKEEKIVGALMTTANKNKVLKTDLTIRNFTSREMFRLMGVRDEDYEKCAKNQSNASLSHLAGDSIVVNVLMAIFKEMIGSDSND